MYAVVINKTLYEGRCWNCKRIYRVAHKLFYCTTDLLCVICRLRKLGGTLKDNSSS